MSPNIYDRLVCVLLFGALQALVACNSSGGGVTNAPVSSAGAESSSSVLSEIDYSAAEAMNQRLGRGINFGNAWDSKGQTDKSWSNPIQDEWFAMVKAAGFQSVRLPVRWNYTAENAPPFTISATRVAGVKEDIGLSLAAGLPVIINMHHYDELYAATGDEMALQKTKFCAMWEQISYEFKDYPNDSVAFEVLNEAREMATYAVLNELVSCAYTAIRAHNPGRTILVNPGNWGKFEAMEKLELPPDGNMIVSGHYYEPFTFSHQGHSTAYPCGANWGSKLEALTVKKDLASFVTLARKKFPGVLGTHIPLNVGEFGGSSKCAETTDSVRSLYTEAIARAAEDNGMSWHYWGLTGVNFDAYNKSTKTWRPEILRALIPDSPSL